MKHTLTLAVIAATLLMASCGQNAAKPEHHHQGVLVADTAGHVRPVFLCPDANGGHNYNVGQTAFATYHHNGVATDTLYTYTVIDTAHADFIAAARSCNYAGVLEAVAEEAGY